MSYRVILLDPHQHALNDELVTLLNKAGAEYEARLCTTDEELTAFCLTADAIMTSNAQVRRATIEKLQHCRIIARLGIGYDNVDHIAAGEFGIPVTNVPGFCSQEVATHAIALMLACDRKLLFLDQEMRRGNWRQFDLCETATRLNECVFGCVGFGTIGQATAQRAAAFGLKIAYFDPFLKNPPDDLPATRFDQLEHLLQQSDIVSLHVPLIDETKHLISMPQFQLMKSSATLINTSRGGIIQQEHLIEALRCGQIAAAGLDVFDPEPPPPDCPLFELDNVILSPHTSGHTRHAMQEVRRRVVEEVVRALQGKPLQHVVNLANLR